MTSIVRLAASREELSRGGPSLAFPIPAPLSTHQCTSRANARSIMLSKRSAGADLNIIRMRAQTEY